MATKGDFHSLDIVFWIIGLSMLGDCRLPLAVEFDQPRPAAARGRQLNERDTRCPVAATVQ
jgi:hypothetical protein